MKSNPLCILFYIQHYGFYRGEEKYQHRKLISSSVAILPSNKFGNDSIFRIRAFPAGMISLFSAF